MQVQAGDGSPLGNSYGVMSAYFSPTQNQFF